MQVTIADLYSAARRAIQAARLEKRQIYYTNAGLIYRDSMVAKYLFEAISHRNEARNLRSYCLKSAPK